jgi:hypothetical protein
VTLELGLEGAEAEKMRQKILRQHEGWRKAHLEGWLGEEPGTPEPPDQELDTFAKRQT